MARHKDGEWGLADPAPTEHVAIAVLMDIRDELKRSNQLLTNISSNIATMAATLACPNFIAIPTKLESIRRNTAKPRKTE